MGRNEVTLVTGETVSRGLLMTVLMTLDLLQNSGHVRAIHSLLQLCRDEEHRLWLEDGRTLRNVGLLETWDATSRQGSVRQAMVPIILAAVKEVPGGVTVEKKMAIIRRS